MGKGTIGVLDCALGIRTTSVSSTHTVGITIGPLHQDLLLPSLPVGLWM